MPDAPTEATLTYGDTQLSLPRVSATDGNDAVDVSKLLSTTDLVTLDNGRDHTRPNTL